VVQRYEHADVGGMVHVDTKKLGRIVTLGHRITGDRRGQRRGHGWEFVHVAVDDRSRVAYVELLPDERTERVRGFCGARWLGSAPTGSAYADPH